MATQGDRGKPDIGLEEISPWWRDLVEDAWTGGREHDLDWILKQAVLRDPTVNFRNRALINASGEGSAEMVEVMLKLGARVNAYNGVGLTSLHIAAAQGFVHVVNVLIAHGADTRAMSRDARSPLSFTPLVYATQYGCVDVVRTIIGARKAQPLLQDEAELKWACFLAIEKVDSKMLKVLLVEGADLHVRSFATLRLLRSAARVGQTACVLVLLDHHSADDLLPDPDGVTPLMLAAGNGHLDVVKVLLAYGAEINAKDKDGRRAVAYASRNGHRDVVRALVSHQAAPRAALSRPVLDEAPVKQVSSKDGALVALMDAACAGIEAKVDEVLRSSPGLDVNALDEGETALIAAVCGGHVGVARKLLAEYRADPNVSSTEGERFTCLMLAASEGDKLVRLLLEYGANVHAKDLYGCTAVYAALASRDGVMVVRSLELLKAHGADLMATNNNGVTALMLAAWGGLMEVVRYLLANGADPTARDGDGKDAIAWAEQGEGNTEVVAMLSEAVKAHMAMLIGAACRGDGAKVDELLKSWPELDVDTLHEGKTALMQAVRAGQAGIARKLLAEYRANPNIFWMEGKRCTCLMMAVHNGNEELVRLLLEHGANVHAKDDCGCTAVHHALRSTDVVAVRSLELLKAHGGDFTTTNEEVTVLMMAASGGQMMVVRYLLANGADPTARDDKGRDAIAWAKMTSEISEAVGVLSEAVKAHMGRLAAQIEGCGKGETQTGKDKNRKKKHWRKGRKGEGVAVASDARASGRIRGVDVNVDAADVGVDQVAGGDKEQQLQQVTAAVAVARLREGGGEPHAEEAEAQDSATAVAVPVEAEGVQRVLPPVELTEEDFDDAPTLFECPISHTIMRDPVTAQDGYSYERSHIETWIKKAAEDGVQPRSLMTNEPMDPLLTPTRVLKCMIDEYMERKLTQKKTRIAAAAQAK